MPNLSNRSHGLKGRGSWNTRRNKIARNRMMKKQEDNVNWWLTKSVMTPDISKESIVSADISNCSNEIQEQPSPNTNDCLDESKKHCKIQSYSNPCETNPTYWTTRHNPHYDDVTLKTKGNDYCGSRNLSEYEMYESSRLDSWGHFVDFFEE